MDAKRYSEIAQFLKNKIYPSGFNKSKKQSLRRLCVKFKLENEKLFYIGKGKKSIVVKNSESAKEIFRTFHYMPIGGHSGINKTISAIRSRYYWPYMTVDIEKWISECNQCRQQIVPTQLCREMQNFKVSEIWELLGMDIIGPLPATIRGHMYILTVTDLFSKWVEAVPLKTMSAEEVIQSLVNIFLSCGCPKRILSDQGQNFVKQINMELTKQFTVTTPVTAVYHPQTNCLDEMTNALIKSTLAECVSEHQDDWDNYMASAVFSTVTKPNNTTKVSPFFLMYNREARFPSQISTDHLKPFTHAHKDLLNNTKHERDPFQVVNQPDIEALPINVPSDCLDTVEEHFGNTLSNNQLFDMECEHAYSSVRTSAWDNGLNGTVSNIISPKRKRSCTDNESIVSNGTNEPGEERTSKVLSKVTRGSFVSIRPNQGVFQSESWKPHGSTLYHPVVSQLLVNIEKYDQISFEEGAFFIGDASGGCLQKESGHAIHCWRNCESIGCCMKTESLPLTSQQPSLERSITFPQVPFHSVRSELLKTGATTGSKIKPVFLLS